MLPCVCRNTASRKYSTPLLLQGGLATDTKLLPHRCRVGAAAIKQREPVRSLQLCFGGLYL